MLELSAKLRQEMGRQNKRVRKQGFIPAILYGRGVKNLPLMVDELDFGKVYQKAGESTLVKLKIQSPKSKDVERVVLIHDFAKDPISDKFIHIDFNQVKLHEAVTVEVPLVFVGKSEAVEKENGVLIKNIQEVEVEALPQNLPHEIEVDISVLVSFDDHIYIKDLKVLAKAKIMAEPEEMVASVIPPRTKAELEELEEAPTEEVEAVEVEEKGKAKEEIEAPTPEEGVEVSTPKDVGKEGNE